MTGIHYRHVAHEAMMETRYNHGIEYVLLSHVPARLELEIKAASSLCKIEKMYALPLPDLLLAQVH